MKKHHLSLMILALISVAIVGCRNKGDRPNDRAGEPKSAPADQTGPPSGEAEKKEREEIKAKVEAIKKEIEFIEVGIKHIQYEKFSEKHKVKFDEDMEIGDSEYVAVVVDFVPDFTMDRETKEVTSRSAKLDNPAIKIELYKDEYLAYDTWAIYSFPSYHRVRQPGLIFSFLNAKIGEKLLSDTLPQEIKGPIADLSKTDKSRVEERPKKEKASVKQGIEGSGSSKNDPTPNHD